MDFTKPEISRRKKMNKTKGEKISEARKRNWKDSIYREKMILALSKGQKGRKLTVEVKEKMRIARKAWWKNNPEKAIHARLMISKNHARPSLGKIGSLSPTWKGGRYTTKRDGYVFIYKPNHPFAKRNSKGGGGYVLEHRFIMEQILGRYLTKDEDVHHINGIKSDNRFENLMLISHNHHYQVIICPKCNFKFHIQ